MDKFVPKNIDKNLVGELNPDLESFFDLENEPSEPDYYPIQNKVLKNAPVKELEEVARGGEKCIIKAYDSKADRYIAVARPLDTTQEGIERFLREARITASLEHPNIVSVFDISVDENNQPFFTTELLQDKSLKALVEEYHKGESILPLEDLLDILIKVCDAVSYAHSRNVIHLDIKPENIQVGKYGNVLLIDWGLAKILSLEDEIYINESDLDPDVLNSMTLKGTLKGSPGFMAPEQAGLEMEKNKQTDVYALGAVLYFILTGKPHIEAKDLIEMLQKTCLNEIRPIREATDRELPDSLVAVCKKALMLNQEERYSSVSAFKNEIQAYLRGFATEAESAGFVKQLALLYKRKTLACQVILASFFILVAVTLIFIKTLSEREKQAVTARNNAEKNLELLKVEKRKRDLIETKVDEALNLFVKNLNDEQLIEEQFASLFVGASISTSRSLDFENAMVLCESVLKKYPKNAKALSEKGYLHLIDHEFKAARESFWACSTEAPHIFELARLAIKYSKLKPDDTKRMSLEETVTFLNELPEGRSWLKMYLLIRERQLTESVSEFSKWVKEYLFFLNPDMKKEALNFKFDVTNDGNKLTLAGSENLKRLGQLAGEHFPYRSVLETLDLAHLDISNTKVQFVSALSQLNLKTLNLYNSKVESFAQLEKLNLKTLEKIYIRKGQIKKLKNNRLGNAEIIEQP